MSWQSTWHDALDDMELDVADIEAMITRLHAEADWVPPQRPAWALPDGLGPFPASLAERAQAILERQQRTATELTRAMVGNRRQRRAAASASSRPSARPVYVDTAV